MIDRKSPNAKLSDPTHGTLRKPETLWQINKTQKPGSLQRHVRRSIRAVADWCATDLRDTRACTAEKQFCFLTETVKQQGTLG